MAVDSFPEHTIERLSLERLSLERDLYLGLLRLSSEANGFDFLRDALQLVLRTSRATRGYLEVFDDGGDEPTWWTACGCSDEELHEIRSAVSHGIISEAVASGETVLTPSALLDPRFQDRRSVRRSNIEAVLCTPIGEDPPLGVVYLQGEINTFGDEDVAHTRLLARHLAPLIRQSLSLRRVNEQDATRSIRAKVSAEEVVGRSPALARVLEDVSLVARLDVSVLITGETGTGKSQLARAIHLNSPRRHSPFVELNCAAIPESLMESELFGALPGAHSSATHRIHGKVAAAEGGTLVLDEVTELTITAQAKLLQLLQTREYYALGAAKPSKADVRVIACSNLDLNAAVASKRFREDLLYRLQVMPLRMPSLSERVDDLEILAQHFCERAVQRHRLPAVTLSLGALRAIRAATWRGNVRELAHVVEAGTIRAAGQSAERVEEAHLFGDRQAGNPEAAAATFQEQTRRFQRQLLETTLDQTGWNVAATARTLDLARSHVYNLIKAFGLVRD
jgi:Nif-specific regulatory protein